MSKKNALAKPARSFHVDATPKTFDEAVDVIAKVEQQMADTKLVGSWYIGKMVSDMQEAEGVYGKRITTRVSEALKERGRNVGKRLIEEYHKAYKRYPQLEDVEKLSGMGLEWSQMRFTNRIEDKKKREKVVREVVQINPETKRTMSAKEVENYVQKINNNSSKDVKEESKEELPKGHPVGFFNHALDFVKGADSRLDRLLKPLEKLSDEAKEIIAGIEKYTQLTGDVDKVTDEQFGSCVDSCAEAAELAKVFVDGVDAHKKALISILDGLQNSFKQNFAELDKKVFYDEDE